MVPIVLIRGLLRESGHWKPLVEALQTRMPNQVILTPNVAGNGSLHFRQSPSQIEKMLPGLLEQLPEEYETFHVVAISMGSMLASVWAKAHPHQVATLTMINPSFSRFSPFWQRINIKALIAILASKPKGRRDFEAAILFYTCQKALKSPATLDHHVELATKHPVSFGNAMRQLLAAARFKGFAEAPNTQVQIIVSSEDQLVSSECGRAIANAWKVELVEFNSHSHDLPLSKPFDLANHLSHWTEDNRRY